MSVTTWEYITTPLLIHNTTAILNTWGAEGWELVQIITGPEGGLVAYFKRPLVPAHPSTIQGEKMSALDARLAELGIDIPDVVAPVAAYVPAIIQGNLVFTAGQLPMVSGALPATGKVGEGHGLVPASDAKDYARIAALNALAAVKSVLGSLDRVTQIVKVTGFVASVPEFTGQPGVVNGASEVLGQIFGDAGIHARSAVGVAVLPLDAPVEVELIVAFE
jgi:enamine deaminase RidA (YjgF/YER057c/UK114 family)